MPKTYQKKTLFIKQNVAISQLGTTEYPWQLSVEIRSGTGHASAVLGGTTTVNATNGWFNFMDLSISLMGTGYILDFKVIYPSVAENFTLASSAFDVAGRPLRVNMKMLASGNKIKDSPFAVTLNLQDVVTSETISDIVWRVCESFYFHLILMCQEFIILCSTMLQNSLPNPVLNDKMDSICRQQILLK